MYPDKPSHAPSNQSFHTLLAYTRSLIEQPNHNLTTTLILPLDPDFDPDLLLQVDEQIRLVEAMKQLADTVMPDTPNSFFIVTAFLKVFLADLELDKAFTGGLSSFRLYVMVTHVLVNMKRAFEISPYRQGLQQNPNLPGISPATVLLEFFRYYKKPERLNATTELRVHLPAPSSSSSSSSLSSSSSSSSSLSSFDGRGTGEELLIVETSFAFTKQVQACQEAFSDAFKVLHADFQWWTYLPNDQRRRGPNAPLPSFLGR